MADDLQLDYSPEHQKTILIERPFFVSPTRSMQNFHSLAVPTGWERLQKLLLSDARCPKDSWKATVKYMFVPKNYTVKKLLYKRQCLGISSVWSGC